MRFWIKALIGVLALVLVLVAGVAVLITLVDTNAYRGAIADVVEGATGRELRVAGDLRIKLLPVPSLEANEVTFANAPWASQPDMVRVKRVRAELALSPLLTGRIVVRRFVAIEPQVFLETDADGRGNWQFGEAGDSSAETGGASGVPLEELDIIVGKVRIEKAGLAFLDGKTKQKIILAVDELTIGPERPGGRVVLSLRAAYQDLPVTLDGRFGAAGAILRNQPIEVDVQGTLGEARFKVQGTVGKPLEGRDVRLDVGLESKSTKKITDVAGVEIEEIGPVALELRLVEAGGQIHLDPVSVSARPRDTDLRLSGSVKNIALGLLTGATAAKAQSKRVQVDLEGSFGDARYSIVGDVGNPIEARDLRLDVAFASESTRSMTALAGIEVEEIGPVSLTFTILEQGGRYNLEDIQMTARPRSTDARISGSVKNLDIGLDGANVPSKPAKLNLEGALGKARFAITGDVGKPMEGKDLRLNVALQTDSTKSLTALAGVDVEEFGPLKLEFRVIEKGGRFDLGAIDMKARPRDADVTVKGSVRDLTGNPRPTFDVSLSAKSLSQLYETLPDVGPVSVSAKVRPDDNLIEIRDLVAKVGKSDLSGSASVDTSGKRPSARLKLRARVIDLAQLVPPADKSETGAAVRKPSDGRMIPDTPLPLDALNRANGDLELAVDRLITPALTLDKVSVVARLDDGNLTVEPAARIAGGSVRAAVNVEARARPAKFTLDVDAKKISIGALTKELRGYETSKGLDANLKMKLSGQGDSLRALMAGLDGDIRLEIGEGLVNNDVLDRVGADLLTKIIGVAVPSDEKDIVTTLNCGVVRFAVRDGNAVADKTLVMETEKVLLVGGGLVDLKTETLDLGAKLAARKGIRIGAGTLSSLLRVQGTLAEPKLGTDLTGVVTTGARVGIAVATLGLSLVAESVYVQISEDDSPCETALSRQIDVTPTK